MMNPLAPLRRDSLAGTMDRIVRRVVVLVLVVAVTGAAGLAISEHLRQGVLTRQRPAAIANDHLMRDLRLAQSAMRDYAASGDQSLLTQGVPDRATIRTQQDRLDRLSDADTADLRAAQDRAIETWWAYRDTVVQTRADGGDVATLLAHTPFGTVLRANEEVGRALTSRISATTTATTRVLWATGAILLLETGTVAAVVTRLRRRLIGAVLVPLQEIRDSLASDERVHVESDRLPAEVRDLVRVVDAYMEQNARADEQHAQAVARLESLDRQKTDFMATVSHELRTPLTSIAGYVELVADGDFGEVTEQQAQALEVVRRNTARLRALIEELLVLSRIEADGVQLDLAPTDLVDLALLVVENLQPQANAGGVALSMRGREPAMVEADATQLERALTNVVGNAVKFTPRGGSVRVDVNPDGAQCVVQVRDTGVGIPADDLVDVGRRFFRARNVTDQAISGTGLGLSIVAATLDSHQGSYELDSTEGVGTTVTLRLPRIPS